MDNDNSLNRKTLDDDIMQCRADILRSRKRSKGPAASLSDAVKTQDTANIPAVTEKKVKIASFEELIAPEKQVVDGQWESPLESKPVIELDPTNIVTAEEEAALFPVTETTVTQQDDRQSQETASEEGLDALRAVVAEANIQAEAEIQELELEGIEEMMICEGIEELADEKAAIANEPVNLDKAETINISDPLDSQDEISQDSPLPDEKNAIEETPALDDKPANREKMIPKFDLAEQILTEQRQVASKRRQRPGARRNLNVMPIAGTVGKIIEEAKKAVTKAAEKKASMPEKQVRQIPEETFEKKPVLFDRIEIEKIQEIHSEPELSVAACRIINDSDRLNPFQEDIITSIVSRDIAQLCGDLANI